MTSVTSDSPTGPPFCRLEQAGSQTVVGSQQAAEMVCPYMFKLRKKMLEGVKHSSKDSSHHGFVRKLSYGRISKVFENRDFQIWDYGAEILDLAMHSYS